MRLYRDYGKRALDLLLSMLLLVALAPLLLVTAGVLYFGQGGQVLFIQERPGRGGRPFRLVKFKTMRDPIDASSAPSSDKDRMTAIGAVVRKLSLDELPQLINVLRGEMSLVGPRPLLTEYLPLYNETQARRHEVAPGITGLAQVSGRNLLSWEEKFSLDVEYVDSLSFFLDARIVLLTVIRVLWPRDVDAGKQVTMERFRGSNTR